MRKFGKVASVLASTAVLGSTFGFAGLAAAATYPAPFVEGGSADVALVWGGPTKAPLDAAAVVDITTSLTNQVTADSVSSGSSSTVSGGDFVLLAKSSDNLNLGNTWGVFTGTIDDDDLTTLLADGTYRADDNDEFDFEQKITIGTPTFEHFQDSNYEDLIGVDEDTPALGFQLPSGTFIMNYTLDFTEDAESNNVSTSNTDLEDFEGSDFVLMGKTYYVSDFKQGSGASFGQVTLLDSANVATVEEGETTTVTVGDNTYDVSISFIDSDEVKFLVNGELAPSSGKLQAGDTYRLSDDAYIGVRDVSKTEVAGTVGQTTFSIGSGKLELNHGSDIKLNDDEIDGMIAYVYRGTASGSDEKLDKIAIEWKTDEDMFLTPATELEMPGFGALKFSMNDLVRNDEEKITVENDGTTSIRLKVPIKDGDASFNILYADSTGNITGIGKDSDDRLATGVGTVFFNNTATVDEWFVATYNVTSEAQSYLLSADVSDNDNRNSTTIKNEVTGQTVCEEKVAGDTCDIGDVSFTVDTVYKVGSNEWVNFTAGSDVNFNTIYSDGGLRIYLPTLAGNESTNPGNINLTAGGLGMGRPAGYSDDSWYLFMHGEDKDDDLAQGTRFSFTINDNSDKELQVVHVNTTGGGAGATQGGENGQEIGDTDVFEAYVLDEVAPKVLHTVESSGQDTAEVYYPMGDSESYAEVFLTEIGATIVAGSGGSSGSGSANIVSISDSEIASVAGKNVVVVGGSCVNSVAANLLNLPSPTCGADWTAATNVNSGEYLIHSLERDDGSMATIVAGYNAGDTTNAAKYLTTQTGVDTSAGTKYIGTTQTSATIVTDEVAADDTSDDTETA